MNRTGLITLFAMLVFVNLPERASGQGSHPLPGTWDLVPGQSTDIDHFGALTVELRQTGGRRLERAEVQRARRRTSSSLVVIAESDSS